MTICTRSNIQNQLFANKDMYCWLHTLQNRVKYTITHVKCMYNLVNVVKSKATLGHHQEPPAPPPPKPPPPNPPKPPPPPPPPKPPPPKPPKPPPPQ